MVIAETETATELLREQIGRIVRSEEFRTSEVLRRLLLYLSEKAASGEADQLKEYVVAIEGLGKPSSYDPQHNSAVRIQVGRLRQKLAEYYRTEGLHDPMIVDLPKGRFRLVYEVRKVEPEAEPPLQQTTPAELSALQFPEATANPAPHALPLWPLLTSVFAIVAAVSIAFAIHAHLSRTTSTSGSTEWPVELRSFWAPFTESHRPLIVVIEDPLFVELHSNPGVYYRDRSLNKWSEIEHSDSMQGISRVLGSSALQPSRYYTAFGEADAAFRLGRLLGSKVPLFTIAKASQVTWQQMSDNNVIFIGVENLFFQQAKGLPLEPQMLPVLEGVRNPHPARGELPLYQDQYETAPTETGVIYALVSHLPGPLGSNDVQSFTSNRSAGYVGAVQAFADPRAASKILNQLKASCGGHMPRYYQVLLRIRFTDDIPTETNYVLGRELK